MTNVLRALNPILAADGILTIQFSPVAAVADDVNIVIQGVERRSIRVLGYVLIVTVAGTIGVEDTGGAVLAKFPCAANGGVSYSGGVEAPAFWTAVGQGLVIRNPAGVDTLGHMTYVLV